MAIKKQKDDKAKEGTVEEKQTKTKKTNPNVVVGWIIAIGVILTVAILVMGLMRSSNNFTVDNMKFTKSYLGNLPFYKANFPIVARNQLGDFKVVGYKEVSFRNDPRLADNIALNLSFGLGIIGESKVYVSAGKNLESTCKDNGIAMIDLGRFFTIANYDVKGATDDPAYKNSSLTPYVTCENHPDNTVIIVQKGTETKVSQTAKNCYEISYTNCEVTMASERLELEVFKSYMGAVANLTAS